MHVQIDDRGQSEYEDRIRKAWNDPKLPGFPECRTDPTGRIPANELDCTMADGERMVIPIEFARLQYAKKAAECGCTVIDPTKDSVTVRDERLESTTVRDDQAARDSHLKAIQDNAAAVQRHRDYADGLYDAREEAANDDPWEQRRRALSRAWQAA